MNSTLHRPGVRRLLDSLFEAADDQEDRELELPAGVSFHSGSAQQRADAMAGVYMPVSRRGSELLYSLVRAMRPECVVEFGTSFGISTIHLAAAVADNGCGRVITTELSATKADAARRNLRESGLDGVVTILRGDARDTLSNVDRPVGFVLLDGWKDLLLPVLHVLQPKLAPGALVIADDSKQEAVAEYLTFVRNPKNGYVSTAFPVDDGMEISCRV